MARFPIIPVKMADVNRDLPPSERPPDVYSDVKNIRYTDHAMQRVEGYTQVFASGMPALTPLYVQGIQYPDDFFWIYASSSAIYSVDTSGTHTDLTPGAGITSLGANTNWYGGQINGVPYIGHANQDPLYWDGNTASNFAALSGWPANTAAKVIRTYQNYLVALDITDTSTSTNYQNRIKWSASASAGNIPNSWDETDVTLDAGEIELGGTQGRVIDCLPLYGDNIVYKDNSCFVMSAIGGNDVFAFRELFREVGILAKNCVAQYRGKHIVLTQDDLIVHDGQQIESIANKRVRRWLFNNISPDYYFNSLVVPYHKKDEIWICFPDKVSSNGYINQALIWNYQDNRFGHYELPEAPYLAPGIVDTIAGSSAAPVWNSATTIWDNDTTTAGEVAQSAAGYNLLMAASTKLYQVDVGTDFDGSDYESYVERISMPLTEAPFQAKFLRAIWPNMEGDAAIDIKMRAGAQYWPDDPIEYTTESSFDLGSDDKFDVFSKGRFLTFRIRSIAGDVWKLHGIGLEVKESGRF